MRNTLITILILMVVFYLFSYFIRENVDLTSTTTKSEYIKLFSADHDNKYCLISEQKFKYKTPEATEEVPEPEPYIDILEVLDALKKLKPSGYDRGTTIVDVTVEDRVAIITIQQVYIMDGSIIDNSVVSSAEQGYLNITNTLCLNEVFGIDSVQFKTSDEEEDIGFVDISKPYTPTITLIPTGR